MYGSPNRPALIDVHVDRQRDPVVRKNDIVFLPPGVPHSIQNTELGNLTFIVATTPAKDG